MRKTSSIDTHCLGAESPPNCLFAASSLKVPNGPKKATESAFSKALQLDITLRKIAVTASSGNGPWFKSTKRRNTCASRSGR